MKYLLDTNICIYIIKARPAGVLARFHRTKAENIAVSSVTVAELEYGVSKSARPTQNRTALLKFLVPFRVLDFDSTDAMTYGLMRADLEARGRTIGPYDLQIAAQAMRYGVALISNNVREFSRVPGLKLENWAKN